MQADVSDRPGIVIVTVTYNAEKLIDDFSQSLLSQSYCDWRLIVVDNASVDGTLENLRTLRGDPRVEIIACDSNTGAAAGNNIGLERALMLGGSYILMTNNDVIFGPDVLRDMLLAKRSVGTGALSATLLYEGDSQEIWYEGGRISTRIGVRCFHDSASLKTHSNRPPVYETSYAPTTFLLFDASSIENTGRLDERYFAYWEDADYIWRLKKSGFGVWVSRDTHVIHKVGQASGGGGSIYSNKQYYKNQILFAKKHFSETKVILTIFVSFFRIVGRFFLAKDRASLAYGKMEGLWRGLALTRRLPPEADAWGAAGFSACATSGASVDGKVAATGVSHS